MIAGMCEAWANMVSLLEELALVEINAKSILLSQLSWQDNTRYEPESRAFDLIQVCDTYKSLLLICNCHTVVKAWVSNPKLCNVLYLSNTAADAT